MRIFLTASAVVGALALGSGTASAASSAYCHDAALAYANKYANPVASTVGGAVVGGVAGGILGKILGQGSEAVGVGVGVGGVAGGLIGNKQGKKKHDQLYRESYYECMNTPIPTQVYYEAPPAGSAEWNYFCSLKYKSFRAVDGTFQPSPIAGTSPPVYPPRRICVLP